MAGFLLWHRVICQKLVFPRRGRSARGVLAEQRRLFAQRQLENALLKRFCLDTATLAPENRAHDRMLC